MVHIIIEVPRRDFSNILLTKPFQQSPISVLEAPSNRFEIADIPIAFRDQVCVFGQAFDRKMVEGELTVDCSFCLEQTQRIILGNLTSANDRRFARSLDDVAFLVAIPDADNTNTDCPELYISIRRDRSLLRKDLWTRQTVLLIFERLLSYKGDL